MSKSLVIHFPLTVPSITSVDMVMTQKRHLTGAAVRSSPVGVVFTATPTVEVQTELFVSQLLVKTRCADTGVRVFQSFEGNKASARPSRGHGRLYGT